MCAFIYALAPKRPCVCNFYDPEKATNMIQLVTSMLNRLYGFYKEKLSLSLTQTTQRASSSSQQVSPDDSGTKKSFILSQLNMNEEEDSNDLEDYLNDWCKKINDSAF